MNKGLLFTGVLCLLLQSLPSQAQTSFYDHNRSWGHGRQVGGSTVPNDYLIQMGQAGPQTNSSAPFGEYRTGTATIKSDGRFLNPYEEINSLKQAQRQQAAYRAQQAAIRRAQQEELYQQQLDAQYANMRQPTIQGTYYVPGSNARAYGGDDGSGYGYGQMIVPQTSSTNVQANIYQQPVRRSAGGPTIQFIPPANAHIRPR
jgi:hypothetical protein